MGGNDDLQYMEVRAADGATAKTLTLSGIQIKTNELRVAQNASVRLNGLWLGDVQVSGEFGGSGTNEEGTVTFAAGATLNADWGVWNAANVAPLPAGLTVKASGNPYHPIPLFKAGNAATLVLPKVTVVGPKGTRTRSLECVNGIVSVQARSGMEISFR